MKISVIIIALACAGAASFGARPAQADGVVHVRYFHTDCEECRRVKRVLERLSEEHGTALVTVSYTHLTLPTIYSV